MRPQINSGIKCNNSEKKELIELQRELAETRDLHEKSGKYQPQTARFHSRRVIEEEDIAPKMSTIDSSSDKEDTDKRSDKYNHDHIRLNLENCSMISKVKRDYKCVSKFEDLQFMDEVNLDTNCASIIREEPNNNNSNKFVHLETDHLSLMLPSRLLGRHNLLSLNYLSDGSINNLESLEATTKQSKFMTAAEKKTTVIKTITNIKTTKTKTKTKTKSGMKSTSTATIIEKSKKMGRRRPVERREMLMKGENMLNEYGRNLSSKFKDRIIMRQLKESSLITVVVMFIIFTLTRVTVTATTSTSYSHQHQHPQQAVAAPLAVAPTSAAVAKTAHKTGKFFHPISFHRISSHLMMMKLSNIKHISCFSSSISKFNVNQTDFLVSFFCITFCITNLKTITKTI